MLEEKVREMKSGFSISYAAIKKEASRSHSDGYFARQQQKQTQALSIEAYVRRTSRWEDAGFLAGVVAGFVTHPKATYRLYRGK